MSKQKPNKYTSLFLCPDGRKISKKEARVVLHDVMAEFLFIYDGVTPAILKAIKDDAAKHGLSDPWLSPPDDN